MRTISAACLCRPNIEAPTAFNEIVTDLGEVKMKVFDFKTDHPEFHDEAPFRLRDSHKQREDDGVASKNTVENLQD